MGSVLIIMFHPRPYSVYSRKIPRL